MRTMQGIDTRRRLVRGLLVRLGAFAVAFALAVWGAHALFGDALSAVIADVTSVWVEVPEESVDLYRMLGYQEDSMADGHYRFRDLSDYRAVVSVIEGPVVWSAFAAGLVVISALWCARAAREVDELTWAVSEMGTGAVPELPAHLGAAHAELERLAERDRARERAAQAAEQRKNELVAYLAHDIKTPLTSIVGYLALLAEEPGLPEDTRARYAGTALAKARSLDAMMDEFFEITRYNLGAMPVERERVDAGLLVRQIADELYPQAQARGVSIEVDAPEGACAFIDPDKMARALANIVRNAVAFADRGSAVRCLLEQEGSMTRFVVSDRGKEISPAHLERIFERFFREDGARGARHGGAGLGLAIAREIIGAHGGTVAATSEGGVTTFTVEVPTGLA